jgi:hypothetical protein
MDPEALRDYEARMTLDAAHAGAQIAAARNGGPTPEARGGPGEAGSAGAVLGALIAAPFHALRGFANGVAHSLAAQQPAIARPGSPAITSAAPVAAVGPKTPSSITQEVELERQRRAVIQLGVAVQQHREAKQALFETSEYRTAQELLKSIVVEKTSDGDMAKTRLQVIAEPQKYPVFGEALRQVHEAHPLLVENLREAQACIVEASEKVTETCTAAPADVQEKAKLALDVASKDVEDSPAFGATPGVFEPSLQERMKAIAARFAEMIKQLVQSFTNIFAHEEEHPSTISPSS